MSYLEKLNLDPGGLNYVSNQDLYHPCRLPAPAIDFNRLASDISISTTDRIAAAIRRLTYGQMIALASEIYSTGPITESSLANTVWRWSNGEGKDPGVQGLRETDDHQAIEAL